MKFRPRLATFLLLFAVATAWAHLMIQGGGEWSSIAKSAAGVLSGPFLGGIARDGQECCVEFSAGILPFAAPALLVAIVPQFWKPRSPAWRAARLTCWILGWSGWFFSGLFSLLHALS